MRHSNYPESPQLKNSDITVFSASYKIRLRQAIFAVVLFFLLYFSFLTSLILLFLYTFNRFSELSMILLSLLSIIVFFFSIKFLFKFKREKESGQISIHESTNKALFDFVGQICTETNNIPPKKIYLSHIPNASVRYSKPFLSLFFPTSKELTIGLPLIEACNISEFKSLLAHEFGHFSQRSMKIGSYVGTANNIIVKTFFDEDQFEHFFSGFNFKSSSFYLFGWVTAPIIWILKKIFHLFYILLYIQYSKLSQEMEFHADQFSVMLTGSRIPAQFLKKSSIIDEANRQLLEKILILGNTDAYVENIFELYAVLYTNLLQQQTNENGEISEFIPENVQSEEPRPRGLERLIKPEIHASHPSIHKRIEAIEKWNISCSENKEAAWGLFENKIELQHEISNQINKEIFLKKNKRFIPIAEIETYLKNEQKGIEILESDHNMFKSRFLIIPETGELQPSSVNKENVAQKLESLKEDHEKIMKPLNEINQCLLEISNHFNGTAKIKFVMYEDHKYKRKLFIPLHNRLIEKRDEYFKSTIYQWDKRYCQFYLGIADAFDLNDELKKRYEQHRMISDFLFNARDGKLNIFYKYELVKAHQHVLGLEDYEFNLNKYLDDLVVQLNDSLHAFNSKAFVNLNNLNSTEELQQSLVIHGLFSIESSKRNVIKRSNELLEQLEFSIYKSEILVSKSLIEMLQFQQEIYVKMTEQTN